MTQSKTTKGLAALALTVMVTSFGHAAFSSVQKTAFGAGVTLSGAGSLSMTTAVKDRVTNAAAGGSNLTWGTNSAAPAPGAGFLLADQYIQLNTNITTSNPGGVQIYTDNTNAAANPKFTGVISANTPTPAGLVSGNDTTQTLSTAWEAVSSTAVVTVASDPNNASDPNHFLWLFHEDAKQVAVPSLNAAAFVNGDPFVTVYKNGAGVHFAQGPTQFGGFKSVDTSYIYTEANFNTATTPNTYGTNQLILEAFTL